MNSATILNVLLLLFYGEKAKAQVPTANWDDYLEFFSSLRYCKNMVQEKETYKACVLGLVNQGELKLQGDIFEQLCSNPQGYLNCWKPIILKSRTCNAETDRGVPAVYKASFEVMCGTDRARSNKLKLERAVNQTTNREGCSGSLEHWVDACAHLEDDISSGNSCIRYRALLRCLDIIVCKEQPVSKFYFDLYKEAGKKLRCS